MPYLTCLFNSQALKSQAVDLALSRSKPATLRFGVPSLSASLYLQDLVGDDAKVNRCTTRCGFWIVCSTIDLQFSGISNSLPKPFQLLFHQQNESMLSALHNCLIPKPSFPSTHESIGKLDNCSGNSHLVQWLIASNLQGSTWRVLACIPPATPKKGNWSYGV